MVTMKRHSPTTRQQALLHDLVNLMHRVWDDDTTSRLPFDANDERDLSIRLAGAVFELVRRHPVDDHGRCRRCSPTRSGCRRWLRWPTRKAPCLVLSVVSFYSTVATEHVWLQLLPHLG